jgi:hypothetical protein
MSRRRALALTDSQLKVVMSNAEGLAPADRRSYLNSISDVMFAMRDPSDDEVATAARLVRRRYQKENADDKPTTTPTTT